MIERYMKEFIQHFAEIKIIYDIINQGVQLHEINKHI